ncbi:MAG: Ig-like domain-containing protein [Rubrivivax sp.]
MKTITPLTPSTQMTPVTQTTLITPITPLTRTCPRPLHRSSQTATLTVRVARFVLSATAGAALVACGGGGGSDSSASPPANEAPTVAISQPTANANFAAGQPITIDANALDSDGTVVRVEFFEGATKLGEDTSAPFAFVWTDAAPGSHTVTVRAFDNMGAMSSADVSLVVGLPGAPPPTATTIGPTFTAAAFAATASAGTAALGSASAASRLRRRRLRRLRLRLRRRHRLPRRRRRHLHRRRRRRHLRRRRPRLARDVVRRRRDTQYSGETLIHSDNGIALSRSGVQAYGRSTSDLGTPNPNTSTATGLALASGGTAEVRVRRNASGVPTSAAVLLSNLSLKWNGSSERR